MAGRMTEVVNHLSGKCEPLSSILSTTNERKEERKQKRKKSVHIISGNKVKKLFHL
jgi:hypothetical protein